MTISQEKTKLENGHIQAKSNLYRLQPHGKISVRPLRMHSDEISKEPDFEQKIYFL
jgi:hypothetical protein